MSDASAVSDVSGPCCLWLFWCDCPRQAERPCRVSRLLWDEPGQISQGRWTHGDSAGASNLLSWSTLGQGWCCSLGARTRSGYLVLSLGMCDFLILLGRGTLDSGGCWSLVVWDWSGHRIYGSHTLWGSCSPLLASVTQCLPWCMDMLGGFGW